MDFFLFGSGKGDEDADNVFVTEPVVEWRDNKPFFVENNVLIPASSIKGALAHRTAYNYNKLRRYYAEEHQLKDENENPAVKVLFGTEGNNGKDNSGIRGNVIVNDLLEAKLKDKVFSHIKNDYFTGGTIEGALFQEKSAYGAGVEYVEEILVQTSAIQNDEVCKAFEQSLKDLCNGYLPLGGSTGRGNGFFYGKVLKNDIEL